MRLNVGWLCAISIALTAASARADEHKPPPVVSETKERLTNEEMEALVAGPMKLARQGDWAGAQQALEQLAEARSRQYGPTSVEVADTLNVFMVFNFMDGRRTEALAYAPRVLEAVRQAWGADHLEYALALNDVVAMDYELNHDAVGALAEPALQEAYRIRLTRLGPSHKETIATLIFLGQIQGLRSRTGGDLGRAKTAMATLQKAIAQSDAAREPGNNDNLWARGVLAATYVRNGALQEGLQTFDKLLEMAKAQQADTMVYLLTFAAALQENGYHQEADMIMRPLLQRQGVLGGAPSPAPQ